jgi:hypothetical protein
MESLLDRIGIGMYRRITPEKWERIRKYGKIRLVWRDALITGLIGGLLMSALSSPSGLGFEFFTTRQFLRDFLRAALYFFVVFLGLYALQWRTYERRRARLNR